MYPSSIVATIVVRLVDAAIPLTPFAFEDIGKLELYVIVSEGYDPAGILEHVVLSTLNLPTEHPTQAAVLSTRP